MIQSEKKIEKALDKKINDLGGWSLKLLPFLVSGLPDRLCLLPGGRVFFAETKTTRQKLRPRQKIVCDKLRRLGFKVYVIDTKEEIAQILKEYGC